MFDEDKDKLKKEKTVYLRIKVVPRASRTQVISVMADKTIKNFDSIHLRITVHV